MSKTSRPRTGQYTRENMEKYGPNYDRIFRQEEEKQSECGLKWFVAQVALACIGLVVVIAAGWAFIEFMMWMAGLE